MTTSPTQIIRKSYERLEQVEGIYSGGSISVSSEFLVSVWNDEIKWTDYKTGASLFSMSAQSEITSFDLNESKKQLVLIDKSQSFQIFSTENGSLLKSFKAGMGSGEASRVIAKKIRWHKKGDLIIAGFSDGSVRGYSASGGFVTHDFSRSHQHGAMVTCIAFPEEDDSGAQDSWIVATGGADGSICVWDLLAKRLINRFSGTQASHASAITYIKSFGQGSQRFWMTAGRDSIVRIWNERDFTTKGSGDSICVTPVMDNFSGILKVPNFFPVNEERVEQAFICAGSDKMKLTMWKFESESEDFSLMKLWEPVVFSSRITHLEWISQSQGLFLVALEDLSVFYYKLGVTEESKTPVLSKVKTILGNHSEMTDAMFVNADTLLIGSNDDKIRMWNRTQNDWSLLPGHSDMVLCLAKAPILTPALTGDEESQFRLVASGSKDCNALIYRSDSMQVLGQAIGHTAAVNSIAFYRKAGNIEKFMVTVSSDRTLKLWSLKEAWLKSKLTSSSSASASALESLACLKTVIAHEKDIHTVAVSPNDAMIATGSQDKTIKLWSRSDLSPVATLKGHKRSIWSVQFSPVDRVLVSSSADCNIKLWSCQDFSCLKTFEGHSSSVLRVSFITRGLQLVSTGSDGLLKLWSIKDNECIQTVDCHEDKVWALDVLDDGDKVVTASTDCTLSIWHDVTQQLNEESNQEKKEALLQEQDLSNEERLGNWGQALILSFRLGKPKGMFRILDRVCMETPVLTTNNNNFASVNLFERCLSEFLKSECEEDALNLNRFLFYLMSWNSGTLKTACIAQRCFHYLVTHISPRSLVRLLSKAASEKEKLTSSDENDIDNNSGNSNLKLSDLLQDLNDLSPITIRNEEAERKARKQLNNKAAMAQRDLKKLPDVVTMLKALSAYTLRHAEKFYGDMSETQALLDHYLRVSQ